MPSYNLIAKIRRRLALLIRGSDLSADAQSQIVKVYDRLTSPTFPVDIVYTWVDGNDPAHAAKLTTFAPSIDRHRYTDHEELRYSLRSVEQYAPWVNHIYIVTDRQRPHWLGDHPKVTVVDHTTILDQECLPTFNSHVIESALHKIPGLSEHYVYLNDDLLFLAPVDRETFFTSSGLVYAFISSALLPDDRADQPFSVTAQMNAVDMISRLAPTSFRYRLKHTYYPQRRSVIEDLEKAFPDEFRELRLHRFRTAADFVTCTTLHGLWAYMTGRGLVRQNRTHYVAIRSAKAASDFARFLADKDTERARSSLCINDAAWAGEVEAPGYAEQLRSFCEAYFPATSRFERDKS